MSQAIQQFYGQLLEVIHHLGWVEAIDVAVVALALYQLLRLLRGTQGTQVLVGLILLAVIGVVANQFNLVLLGWLAELPAPATIAAAALFGAMLGFAPFNRPVAKIFLGDNLAISEAIRAAERLSSKRQGALIAFERSVGLEDYAATGVRINGEISAEVLQSIFYPNSPLHDGAVIVRGSKIIAAGCLLPLPEEGIVRERLGTRHRAAVGLSLASDALVMVVSEETGSISVIEEGKITRNLDGDGLRQRVSPKVAKGNGFFG